MSAGDPTSGEICQRPGCKHDADEHDPHLGYCERRGCECLLYLDADELEDSGPRSLDFDHDDERGVA